MSQHLFDQLIFGPIRSRRLGLSLGVNLLPVDAKICSFNCVYCECGLNKAVTEYVFPTQKQVFRTLEATLQKMHSAGALPDTITFAGNGEPTLHPAFGNIIHDTLALRNKYCQKATISVLSNATRIHQPHIIDALLKVDNNILKFDSAIDATMKLIDQPQSSTITVEWLIEKLAVFQGKLTIQTMFLKGKVNGIEVDNTTDVEVRAWIEALKRIQPKQVMIYSLDRATPFDSLVKIDAIQLQKIADMAVDSGFDVQLTT